MVHYSAILLGSVGISTAMAQSYKIAKSYVGQGFADEFGKSTKRQNVEIDSTGTHKRYLVQISSQRTIRLVCQMVRSQKSGN
jgi:hypothetical protein